MNQPQERRLVRRQFSLIEILVVIVIISLVLGLAIPNINNRLQWAKWDTAKNQCKILSNAIDTYYLDTGDYPIQEVGDADWDDSHNGDFIPVLVLEGYLTDFASDPTNDATYHYEYRVLNTNGGTGCGSPVMGNTSGHYYILRVSAFEDSDFAAKHASTLSCGGTDWGDGYAYVVGGGAKFE